VTRRDSDQLASARQLGDVLERQMWDGGVRIVLQGAMQAIVKDHQVDMHASWRADVFYGKGSRRADFTLVAESPREVLEQLGRLAAGDVADDEA